MPAKRTTRTATADEANHNVTTEAQAPVDALADVDSHIIPPASDGVTDGDRPPVVEPSPLNQVPHYKVAARNPAGFWRCGRKWHPDGEVLTLAEIGGEQVLALLLAEPMLVVQVQECA